MEATPQMDTQEIGLVGRMIRVFHSPGETFEALSASHGKSDWLVPTIIGAILAIVAAYYIAPIAMKESMGAMQEQMQNMPAESREMMEKVQSAGQIAGLVMAPIATFVIMLIVGGLLLLVSKIFSGEGNYSQMLGVHAYASLIGVIKTIVVLPLMVSKQTIMVYTGVGILLSDDLLQTFAGRFLAGLDLFIIWQAILTAMGLSIVGKISSGKAYGTVLVLVVIGIAITAAVQSLQSAFTPGG